MTQHPALSPFFAISSLPLLDRAIFASISAMSAFALFSPLL